MPGTEYNLHGAPLSLFTRKLEAALTFYGVPFEHTQKGTNEESDLEKRAGTHQIPILVTPENWALADTTPILQLLDSRFPYCRLFPEGPLGVLVHIAEEVLDEWVARVMVHYRWHKEENTRDVISLFSGQEISLEEARKHPVAQWGPRACRATGTERPEHQEAAEQEYLALMAALDAQLTHTAYALGDRPTAVDCILLGGLRAHTNRDPYPDLSQFKNVMAWDAHRADRWNGTGGLAPFPTTTPFGTFLFEMTRDHYVPVLAGHEEALVAGDKTFTVDTYGAPCTYLARPYPVASANMVRRRIANELTDDGRDQVTSWLEDTGLTCFLPT